MKNQRGITLIALVVTIVVLLILAGITITYVMSEGGIFNTAKKAATETEVGAIKDYVSSAVYDLSTYAYAPTAYTETPEQIFTGAFPTGSEISATDKVTASYDATATPKLSVTIDKATVKLPGSETKYTVSYSAGTITVTK